MQMTCCKAIPQPDLFLVHLFVCSQKQICRTCLRSLWETAFHFLYSKEVRGEHNWREALVAEGEGCACSFAVCPSDGNVETRLPWAQAQCRVGLGLTKAVLKVEGRMGDQSAGSFPTAGWKCPTEREERFGEVLKKDGFLSGSPKSSGPAGTGRSLGPPLRMLPKIKRSATHWREFL